MRGNRVYISLRIHSYLHPSLQEVNKLFIQHPTLCSFDLNLHLLSLILFSASVQPKQRDTFSIPRCQETRLSSGG